jgi:small subunit ribosomal protein S5
VRAILEAAGVHDVLTKSFGTTNSHNITKATVDGLRQLRRASDVAQARGMTVQELLGSKRRSDAVQA